MEVIVMKKYTIYNKNKAMVVNGLLWALDIARRESLVGGKVAVFDAGVKVAVYCNGDLVEKNY
jgi:hypothetical protein